VYYHVRITSKDRQRRSQDALALDKEANWIEQHVAAPRREGRDVFIDGQVFSWDSIDQIHIIETEQPSEQLQVADSTRVQDGYASFWAKRNTRSIRSP
jgi:hypothetical protein